MQLGGWEDRRFKPHASLQNMLHSVSQLICDMISQNAYKISVDRFQGIKTFFLASSRLQRYAFVKKIIKPNINLDNIVSHNKPELF